MFSGSDYIYEFGNFRLDTANHSLSCEGKAVSIKPKSIDLLRFLIENRGCVISKDELMETLWRDIFVEEANLTQTIYELRRALGESARKPKLIENVPKRGYRFAGDVRTTALAKKAVDKTGETQQIRSLAVLPFCALKDEDSDESLELGIAETMITGISGLGRMVVRPISSVRRFANTQQDPLSAGRKLQVDTVLHGTIQRSNDDRLRVSARLVQVDSGVTIWAGQFDEHSSDIFLVQDSLLKKILAGLSVKLTSSEQAKLQKRSTENPEVHRLLLLCRFHWHKWTPENWRRAIKYGTEASELDPDHAPSYAWTAASYCTLGIFGEMQPKQAFGQAKKLVEKALEIDEELSKAHEVLGAIKLFYEWDWELLPSVLDRAIELNPSSASARELKALYLIANRQFDAAIFEIRSALSIDPLSLLTNCDLAIILFYSRRYDEAIEHFVKTFELDPHFPLAYYGLGITNIQMKEFEKGIENMRNAAEYSGLPPNESSDLGYAYACANLRAEAEGVIEVLSQKSLNKYVDPYQFAIIYGGLREIELSIEYLERAYENRSRELIYLCNPMWDWLREDYRFTDLLKKIGIA